MEIIYPAFTPSQDIPGQLVYLLPERLGAGGLGIEKFSSGLTLACMDFTLTRPVKIINETTDWNFGVSFNLAGYSAVGSSKYRQIEAKSGISVHYAYPGLHRIAEEIGVTHKSKIAILFDSKTLLTLADGDEEAFLPFLQGYQSQSPVAGQKKMNTALKRALSQLVMCPYRGKTRSLYVEGKIMEIFANSLEQMRPKGKSASRAYRLNKTDTERIHYAAEMLVADPVNPPDLREIAARVGMSRSKFYQDFKMVFGHSPTAYLRRHRLHIARQLLRQGRRNVTEAAFAAGFNNLSYFTRAFTAEFGVSPSQTL